LSYQLPECPGPSPPGMTLPRPFWVRLNRLCTGVDCSAQQCTDGAWCPWQTADEERTADHILASFLYHLPIETLGLAALDDDTVDWLKKNCTQRLMTRSAQTKKRRITRMMLA